MNYKYDLIIVGAGPAGSTAAYYLGGSDKNVLIVDKKSFPREKVCGGGLLKCLDWPLEFENYARIEPELEKHDVNSVSVYYDRKYTFSKETKHLFSHIRRSEFDKQLLDLALSFKNISFERFELKEITKKAAGIQISDGKRTFVTQQLIGADGWNSKVSKFLGNKKIKYQNANCIEYDIVFAKETKRACLFNCWDGNLGYGWLFPTKTGACIGLGVIGKRKTNLKASIKSLYAYCIENKIIPEDSKINTLTAAPVPSKLKKIYASEEIFLIGDALGLVVQGTGEGIYYAMKSGKLAAKSILRKTRSKEIYISSIKPLAEEVKSKSLKLPPALIQIFLRILFFLMRTRFIPSFIKHILINAYSNDFCRFKKLPMGTKYKAFK